MCYINCPINTFDIQKALASLYQGTELGPLGKVIGASIGRANDEK